MIRAILDALASYRLPPRIRGEDPFARAWASADDPAQMIALLEAAARLGLYRIGHVEFRSSIGDPNSGAWFFWLGGPEGGGVRMDVTRAGGADAIRARVPSLPPYDRWARALKSIRARCTTPLSRLAYDLRRLGAPAPDWLAQHSFVEAWRTSDEGCIMRELLALLGRDDLCRSAQAAIDRVPYPPAMVGNPFSEPDIEATLRAQDARIAEAVREAVPEPPPLPRTAPSPAFADLTARLARACVEVARVASINGCFIVGAGFTTVPADQTNATFNFLILAGDRALVALSFDTKPAWLPDVANTAPPALDLRDLGWTLTLKERGISAVDAVAALRLYAELSVEAHLADHPEDAAIAPFLDDEELDRLFS